jgi:hypothetical protein
MEPENRPYIDADTEPGDAGTEEWADNVAHPSHEGHGPLGQPHADADAAIDGSPADEFIHDPDAIVDRNTEQQAR